ncbi:hypothetical protein ACF5W4_09010 [Bacillota bacterium Lsc_1132]
MDYVSFGSITIPTKWLLLAAALLLSYFILKLHKNPSFSSNVFDGISNSLFIGLAVLKLSLMLIEPGLVIKNPLSLLYFTGGDLGYWLAVASAGAYFFWETNKKGVPRGERIVACFYYVLYAYSIFHFAALFFKPGWEHILSLLFSAIVSFWFFAYKKGIPYYSFSIGFALYQLILANLFQKSGSFLSYEYFFYAFLIVLLIMLKKRVNN